VSRQGRRFDGNVVIATGGFDRDPALVRAFLRGPMTAPGSPPTNEGDGLKMGMAAGAALTVGPALVFGWLAGETAAAAARE
jgi:3-oxosteroid 1-dehydrogenase